MKLEDLRKRKEDANFFSTASAVFDQMLAVCEAAKALTRDGYKGRDVIESVAELELAIEALEDSK